MTTLVDALGYVPSDPNPLQRVTQALAATRPAAWALSSLLAPMDRWMLRATDGRTTVAGLTAGLPVITLTTTGARTGLPRSSPLAGIPLDGSLAVIGSNFAQPKAPAWTYNLMADPSATVTYRDVSVPVAARTASDEEYERSFERAAGIYPGFTDYRNRVSHRPIRVFVLDLAP